MLLMQRLVSSSTRAIRTALEKRLDVLQLPEGQLSLFADDVGAEWPDLDGQEQMETLLAARLKGISNERAEVEQLLSLARRCEAAGPDAKAQALLDRLRQLERDENDPELKVLLFTEFVPTQAMLAEFLRARSFTVACLNGSMSLDERQAVQVAFAREARVLVSTDAGSEGLNLQFCHVVVNYDLPWNPMKIEQRIGRVDRIGQAHVVRAVNVTLADTVEHRVREVLEDKLQRILADFGADKLGDVLDSEAAGIDFDDVYARAVVEPAGAPGAVDSFADALRERARAAREGLRILGGSVPPDAAAARKLVEQHLPRWTERMTVSYLRSRADAGTFARPADGGYRLRWEDGTEVEVQHLSIEDARVRALVTRTPVFAPGQPLGSAVVPGVSDKVTGTWSLWRIALESAEERMERVLPIFLSDDDRVLAPTARAVWDRLIEAEATGVTTVPGNLDGAGAREAFERSRRAAEEHGAALYRELLARYLDKMRRERKKAEHAFDARRRAIDRLGLPQVQQHRRRQLDTEQRASETRTAAREHAWPALRAIVVLRVVETTVP
jgi:hypothetical protein